MSLSIIIPCKNEQDNIYLLLKNIFYLLKKYDIEVLVIDDNSTDNTVSIIKRLNIEKIKVIKNNQIGLGSAIGTGIINSRKKYFTIMMADSSDSIQDLKKYYLICKKNKYDGIFGSRFYKKSKVTNYPIVKLLLNRIFNYMVKIIYGYDFNDFTNAFKCYRTKYIKQKILPIDSYSFNVFFEIPIKCFIYKAVIHKIAINWTNQRKGKSNFLIKELSYHYFFTFVRCLYIKKFKTKFTK
jgi:dolichol-phosphate mannosyltransferase